jgi:acetyl esterase/lipase
MRRAYGPDPNQFGDLRLPDGTGPHPLVIVIHGGYWRARYDLSHMEPVAEALCRLGYASWNLEYRRVGHSGGTWPGILEDVLAGCAAVGEFASEYALDMQRVLALGFSAGGHLALCAAAHNSGWSGAISLAGVVDLQLAHDLQLSNGAVGELLGGDLSLLPEASPVHIAISVPQWLIHGTDDDTVPPEISERYATFKRALGEQVHLQLLPGASHFDLIDPQSPHWTAVVSAISCIAPMVRSNSSSVV